jgi:hypothetical protein
MHQFINGKAEKQKGFMDKPQIELNKIKSSSRNILALDILGCIILPFLLLSFRDNYLLIFKEMQIDLTSITSFLIVITRLEVYIGFAALASALIYKEVAIRNKIATRIINKAILVILIILILLFALGHTIQVYPIVTSSI